MAIPGLTTDRAGRLRLRQRSKKLLGNADRVEVAYAVARSSGLVHAQELALDLGMSPTRVRTQLLALCDGGLMRALPRSGLTQDYERIDDDDPFWGLIAHLVAAWS